MATSRVDARRSDCQDESAQSAAIGEVSLVRRGRWLRPFSSAAFLSVGPILTSVRAAQRWAKPPSEDSLRDRFLDVGRPSRADVRRVETRSTVHQNRHLPNARPPCFAPRRRTGLSDPTRTSRASTRRCDSGRGRGIRPRSSPFSSGAEWLFTAQRGCRCRCRRPDRGTRRSGCDDEQPSPENQEERAEVVGVGQRRAAERWPGAG